MSGATIKKKVDDRIKFLIDEAARNKHRGVLLVVGDRARDQVVNLHLMASRANHTSKLSVLWCMKQEVEFGSTGRKAQERVARLEVKGGMSTESTKESFQTFLQQNQIRFCQYKETHKVLGQTFGMAVLQDFEAVTPNVLARTVETVAGGGLVIIMLRAMRSLKQLYTIAMDVHSRFRTEALKDVVPRFNERFLLSLMDCTLALCIDDDLNVLPFTSKMKSLGANGSALSHDAALVLQGRQQYEVDLANLKERLKGNPDVGPIVQMCQTMDQAKTVLSLVQVVSEKTLNTTCAITAARGRGKSAALGMAAAGAIEQGYSNIFCTAPSPENLQTFFEFVIKGLVALGYKDRVDFEAMQSTNPEFSKCVIRVNIFKTHRQTIQFVSANDSSKFAQAELLIVDEAAAIPLPVVKKMLGPYLVFLSSTICGYEGTGRALSMKLVADMRKNAGEGRALRELSLADPIRYGPNDPVEAWLNTLLCLDATNAKIQTSSCPHPSTCELYYINRDALFSYHPHAEKFLHQVMSLLVAAHYKNQPNDLQLMSDAPGHHLFALCGPVTASQSTPDLFCVIHACEEGHVSAVQSNLSKGNRPSGDLIPYTMAQYFLEDGFAKLGGMRIVRIATNPDFQRAGYGSRAIHLLREYFTGRISINPATSSSDAAAPSRQDDEGVEAAGSEPHVRSRIPALLTPLHERPYESLDYLGVSFGVTAELYNFWRRSGFEMVYVRQVPNETTAEHSGVMICPMDFDLTALKTEFRHRFLSLLAQSFRQLSVDVALSIVMDINVHVPQDLAKVTVTKDIDNGADKMTTVGGTPQLTFADLLEVFTVSDLKRLQLCSTAYVDNGVIWDLVPRVARLYFERKCFKFPDGTDGVVLTHAQAAVLLAVGLQCKCVEDLTDSAIFAGVQPHQLRAFLNKSLSRLVEHFQKLQSIQKKRVRDEQNAEEEEEGEETVVEQRDASGNVIGMSVGTRRKTRVEVDSTLKRDARNVSIGTGALASDTTKKLKMSKKTRSR